MKRIEIVLKIIIPFVVGLLLITMISIGGMYVLQNKHINNQAKNKLTSISSSLKEAVKSDVELFKGLIQLLQKNDNVINLVNNRRKDELFIYLSKIFIDIKDKHGITHMAIHNTNKTNFLRLHDKDRHSDIIKRNTLDSAHKTKLASYGIEFGLPHNLTLRVVYPLYNKNKLIGYMELGKRIDKFTPKLTEELNTDVIFTVKRDMISDEEFNSWTKKGQLSKKKYKLRDFYIVDSTVNNISENLKKILNNSENINNVYVQNSNKSYYANSNPFYDVTGKEVGKLYVLLDISKDSESLISLVLKISAFIMLIIISLVYYYYKYVKRTENELNIAHEKIQLLSVTDGMTQLYNKRFFNENVPLQIKRAARNGKYISLLLLDADNFKKYNDNYGHSKGDDVLIGIASRMKELFKRGNDVCYRVGGEEFVIAFESESLANSILLSQKLCKSIESLNIEHLYNSSFKKVTISIGLCTLLPDSKTKLDDLYKNADEALYKSKNSGRNRVTLYKEN